MTLLDRISGPHLTPDGFHDALDTAVSFPYTPAGFAKSLSSPEGDGIFSICSKSEKQFEKLYSNLLYAVPASYTPRDSPWKIFTRRF